MSLLSFAWMPLSEGFNTRTFVNWRLPRIARKQKGTEPESAPALSLPSLPPLQAPGSAEPIDGEVVYSTNRAKVGLTLSDS